MRLMVVRPGPSFSVADVCRGWTRAFGELGVEVGDLNYDDIFDFYVRARLQLDAGEGRKRKRHVQAMSVPDAMHAASRQILAQAFKFWPDVVFVVSGFWVPTDVCDVLRARGMKVVLLCTESPYQDDQQFAMAAHVDVVLLNDPTNIARFRARHPDVRYVPHAYDPAVHHPGPSTAALECDFAFVGTGYPSRAEFFSAVDWTGIDFRLAGMWTSVEGTDLERFVIHPLEDCYFNDETVELYRSCRVSANLYRARSGDLEANLPELNAGWAMGPREVELAACGTFYLREPRGESDEVLGMLPAFTEPAEFEDLLRFYLDRPDLREKLAGEARAAIAERTFVEHARALLETL